MADNSNNSVAYTGKKKKQYDALIELRDRLVDDVRTLSAHSLSSNKQAGEELADVGSDNFIREMGISLMSEEGRKVQLIQDALQRLNDGSYGVCMDCDKKIQEARLEAIPYAQLCVGCKSQREKDARYGHSAEITE